MRAPSWHIITGEYPPAVGGVADYVRSIARALAAASDEVHVWAPAQSSPLTEDRDVHVHSISGGYTPNGLAVLSRAFRSHLAPRRILVQYVPQAFGMKAMNVAFCSWIAGIRNAEVWIMFHEVAVPWAPWWRWKQNVVAATTRLMARLLLSRVDRTLISIPSWEAMLHGMAPRWKGATWLPIPSNIPTTVAPEAIARVRQSLPLRDGGRTIGHFGTYGPLIVPVLMRTLRELLRSDTGRIAVLVGRGSESVAKALQQDPIINGRVVASGTVSATEVAAHLIACDLLVQPYPDGMSTRRTSAMAGLALGVPTVTNQGHATESLWRETQAVELATSEDDLVATAERVLRDSAHAAALGHRARALYDRQFSIEHTVHSLRETGHGGAV